MNFRAIFFAAFLLFCKVSFGSVFEYTSPVDTSVQQADSIMKSIHFKAFEKVDQGKYEEGAKLYREVIWLKLRYMPNDSLLLANVYSNYVNILFLIWKYEEAQVYLDKAIELIGNKDNEALTTQLFKKGKTYFLMNDLNNALIYLDQTEKYMQPYYTNNLTKRLIELKIDVNTYLENYSETLKYLEKIPTYNNLSKSDKLNLEIKKLYFYFKSEENQKFIDFYNSLSKLNLTDHQKIELQLQYSQLLYINLKKIDEAIISFEDLLKESSEKYFSKQTLSVIHSNLGNCYEIKGNYKKALEVYQKALLKTYPNFQNTNFKVNPEVSGIYQEAISLNLFRNKAEVLYRYSKETKDTSFVTSAIELCKRSVNAVQKMRYRVSSDQSQYVISKNDRNIFSFAQFIALEKYKLTKNRDFINLAFQYNEKGKAFTLLAAMRTQKAMDFGDVPANVRNQESELNRKLSLYDELIYKESQLQEPNKKLIAGWKDELFEANNDYSKLLKNIENQYPEYYRLKYDEDVTDMYEIQKIIDKNTVLIEYANLDTILIIYTASREKMAATKVVINSTFEDKCNEFLSLLTRQNFSDSANYYYNKYVNLSRELYCLLIEPIKNQIDGENLIIIPDGAISFIPFDALLTAYVPPGTPDYRNIPYLVKDYSVGYSYSTTIHFNPLQHIKIPRPEVLAFAPLYTNEQVIVPGTEKDRVVKYMDLVSLPGVKIEVENIAKIQKTSPYYLLDAKESIFKEQAGRYKILHLAMHTMIDNKDPMLSRLVFTQVPDGQEDGMLHTYEIYNMKLNSSLTVLSSCSSGFGKIQPGEGVQSLARGFAYAGCPSILMTLWEVGDLSTAQLMTDFYKYLGLHRTKPQALRESKLNFLKDADDLRSNPFFWASFVVIGDSSPLNPFRTDLAALSAFLLILPIGYLRVSYKKYKKLEKKKKIVRPL